MFNLLRMDVYRLLRTKSFWVCLAVLVGVVIFTISSLSFASGMLVEDSNFTDSPGFTVGISELDSADVADIEASKALFTNIDYLTFLGNMSISGELVGFVVAIFMALFIGSEFESGFSKNVFSSLKNRRSYFLSKALIMLTVAVVFFAIATLCALLGAGIAGFDLLPVALGDVVLWAILTILTFWALAMLVALVAWVAKGKTAALIIGIFVSFGLVGGLVATILGYFPDISFLKDFTLYSSWVSLQGGLTSLAASDIIRVACVSGGFLLLYSVLSMVVLRKKDI